MPKTTLAGESLDLLITEYLDVYCTIEKGFQPKTIKGKREMLNRLVRFLKFDPLTLVAIRGYSHHLHKKGWQPSSIKADLKIVKAFINYLYSREKISENYARHIVLPKVRRKQMIIVPAELAEKIIIEGTKETKGDNKLSRKIKKEHRQALRFTLRTGLRVSELLKLRGEDINIEDETYIVHSKGGDIDVLPLPKDMIPEVASRAQNTRVFQVTQETLRKCLKRGSRELSVQAKLTVHTLRHIFCTDLLKNGVPLQIVSRLMRHSSIKITDEIYSHYLIKDLSHQLNDMHTLITNYLFKKDKQSVIIRKIKESLTQIDNIKYNIRKDKNKIIFIIN